MDERLTALYVEMDHCLLAPMEPRPAFVPGEGVPYPRLLLIGEAPGKREAEQRRPFVGPAGKQLDAFLAGAGIDRAQLYVTNVVKFRPTRISPAGREVNRTPTAAEVAAFRPYLLREIAILAPEWIATLGNTPLNALFPEGLRIGDVHGQVLTAGDLATPVFPMYHPASLIYNPGLRDTYANDMAALHARLAEKHDN